MMSKIIKYVGLGAGGLIGTILAKKLLSLIIK